MPDNVLVAQHVPAAWPTPKVQSPAALPEIQAMQFSSLDVPLGTDWSGEFVASSNTASIEVATNLFAFSVPRPQVGHFRFRFHLIDVPAFYVRPYALHVIARNAAGEKSEEDVPFRIRGRL